MAKKKGWFYLFKKLFVSEEQPKPEKKEKRWKWMFGRLRTKRLATLTAPSSPKVDEAEEDQSRQALSVAIASTAAAEAAVAAAKAAVEVVLLTGTHHQYEEETAEVNPSFKTYELAAIRIQTAFRGYLARKALGALKGIVRLQAIIRGRAVRRQAIATLKCLQSIVSIQSQVCSNRLHAVDAENTFHSVESKQQSWKDKIVKLDSKDQRWDGSILSKEEKEAMFLSKKEALIERERIKEYSFSHRRSAESERKKVTGRWRYWLDQWVDTQLSKSKELEDLDSIFTSNPKPKETDGIKPRKLSHHRNQSSLGNGGDLTNSLSSSSIVPTYMAATESAKAKARSLSSPKLRPAGGADVCSDGNSPCKIKQLSQVSSMASEGAIGGGRGGRWSGYQQQRSPGLKGLPGPTRSSRSLKDLSVDSEHSLMNWDRQSPFR